MEQLIKEHSLKLEKNILTITGVTNVASFDAKEVIVNLQSNSLAIKGEELVVVDLDINGQLLVIKGNVSDINYGRSHEKVSMIKRLFK